jgi:stringent starvation protein B
MSETTSITPTRPYMVRALYQWIEDNALTPYLMVDATAENVLTAVMGIYAKENSQGMFFDPKEYDHYQPEDDSITAPKKTNTTSKPKRDNKAGLKVLK